MSGNIKKRKRENSFTQIPNETLRRPDLSWKAKGLLCYLLSNSDSFEIRKTNIHKYASDGYDSTNTAFKELESKGYIKSVGCGRDVNGNFTGYDYEVDETPIYASKTNFSEEKPHLNENEPFGNYRSGGTVTEEPQRETHDKEYKLKNKKEEYKKVNKKSSFVPPLLSDIVAFLKEKGFNELYAKKIFEHYSLGDWKDSHGKPVVNWKQKINTNWLKDNVDQIYKLTEPNLFDSTYKSSGLKMIY